MPTIFLLSIYGTSPPLSSDIAQPRRDFAVYGVPKLYHSRAGAVE